MPSDAELPDTYQSSRGVVVADLEWFAALVRYKQAAAGALITRTPAAAATRVRVPTATGACSTRPDAYWPCREPTRHPPTSVERYGRRDLFLTRADAPTLCEGWTTADLAAHLVIRERDACGDRARSRGMFGRYRTSCGSAKKAKGFAATVALVRSGPPRFPWRVKRLRALLNLNEYFIHHEDVRLGQRDDPGRTDRADLDDAIWAVIAKTAALTGRRMKPFGLDDGARAGESITIRAGENRAVLTGPPSEIAVYLAGRRAVPPKSPSPAPPRRAPGCVEPSSASDRLTDRGPGPAIQISVYRA